MKPQIIFITGVPGSGKSSVSEELCKKFEKAVHIQVDQLRQLVKAGYASPANWTEETEKQYKLARKNASDLARNFIDNGFTVIIDDIVRQKWVSEWKSHFDGIDVNFVLLQPTIEVAKLRNQERIKWTVGEDIIDYLYDKLSKENTEDKSWIIINTSNHTIKETVDEVFAKLE